MELEPIEKGSWYFRVEDPSAGTSIKIKLHARDGNGQPCPEPPSELIAAAEETERNASRLRDKFSEQLNNTILNDQGDVVDNADVPVTGFTPEELLNPTAHVLDRVRSRTRLLFISVELNPRWTPPIDTCGYLIDAFSRVWQVGDDYIEGSFGAEEFIESAELRNNL